MTSRKKYEYFSKIVLELLEDAYFKDSRDNCFLTSKKSWVLSKNSLRIALGRLFEVLETIFCDKEEKLSSKNGFRIAAGHLFKILEAIFCDKEEELRIFQQQS